MTISSVVAGGLVDPDWGNAVADRLNSLGEGQRGKATVTNTAGNSPTINFPEPFDEPPVLLVTVVASATSAEWSVAVRALTSTGFQLRTYVNGVEHGGSVTYHWMAFTP